MVFVTANSRDFGGKTGLPTDFQADLSDLGIEIHVRNSLAEVYEEYIQPFLATVDDQLQRFTEWVTTGDFQNYVNEELGNSVEAIDVDSEFFGFPDGLDELQPERMEVHAARVVSINALNDSQFVVRVAAEGDMAFTQDIDELQARDLEENPDQWFHEAEVIWGYKYRSVSARVEAPAAVLFDILASPEGGTATPEQLAIVELTDSGEYHTLGTAEPLALRP